METVSDKKPDRPEIARHRTTDDSSDSDRLIGCVLAEQYQIVEKIGVGGMGTVYKAVQLGLDKLVAIKIARVHQRAQQELFRLREEAKALRQIEHPNIVKVSAIQRARLPRHTTEDLTGEKVKVEGEASEPQEDILFIVTEFLDGKDLAWELAKHGPMPAERIRAIFTQVASALECAHSHGFIHRDIKPTNIMLVHDEHGNEVVKLLDFGVVKNVATPLDQKLTKTGAFIGTPAYMSPEQFAGKQADARSDIYALGCVMFEAATGQKPFEGSDLFDIAQKHILETVPIIGLTHIDANLAACIERAMQKNPESRFQSMQEFKAVLSGEQALSKQSSAPPAFGSKIGVATVSDSRKKKKKSKYAKPAGILAAAIMILGLGTAGFLGLRSANQPERTFDNCFGDITRTTDPGQLAALDKELMKIIHSQSVPYVQQAKWDEMAYEYFSNHGQIDLAVEHLEVALPIAEYNHSDNEKITYKLAEIYMRKGQVEKAEEVLKRTVNYNLNRDNGRFIGEENGNIRATIPVLEALAGIEQQTRRFSKAAEIFRRIRKYGDGRGSWFDNIATAHLIENLEMSGNDEEAIKQADEWLAHMPPTRTQLAIGRITAAKAFALLHLKRNQAEATNLLVRAREHVGSGLTLKREDDETRGEAKKLMMHIDEALRANQKSND